MTEEYIYAGYVCYSDGKRGWQRVPRDEPGNEDDAIMVKKHYGPDYIIGDVVEVDWEEDRERCKCGAGLCWTNDGTALYCPACVNADNPRVQ